MDKKTGLFYNSEKKELFPMRKRRTGSMPAGKLFWGIPSAAGSRFTLFRPITALEIHRFYPRNDNHAAPALGNGVGQEDGPPYCGGGFWIHPKIGFDIWDAGKASGVLETGVFFSYFGSVNMLCSVVDERSGTDTMLTFLIDKHVTSLNFSIGHRFEFPEDRSLFFGIYGLFGYAWAASDTRLSENKNTGLDFSQTGDRIRATAGAPVAALMADFGYRFSRYAGVFLSGAYIFNDGVMGNFLFGGGIRVYAF